MTPNTTYPELKSGSKGDQVLWMQEHLASAIPTQETTGTFGSETNANLRDVPDRARDPRQRRDRSRDLGGAARAGARRRRLDRRRAERLTAVAAELT